MHHNKQVIEMTHLGLALNDMESVGGSVDEVNLENVNVPFLRQNLTTF